MKILIVDNGLPFDFETPYNKSLGGSEISALLYAKGLSNLNHQIVLLTNAQNKDQQNNIILDHISLFNQYAEQSDVILLNRFIPSSIMTYVAHKGIFYISHDAYDQQNVQWMLNQNSDQILNKIICVSDWQKQTFIDYLNVDPNKLVTLGNPIDYSLYQGYTERDLNKLVFTSIPYKGLEILPDLFNEIKFRSKNKDLHLDIYSSFKLYNRGQEDEQYINTFRKLHNIKDINIFNPISMKQLAYVFKSANMYLAPSLYHETFGRVYVESMAGGCIPVAMNNGANKEIIGDVIDNVNIMNKDGFDMFINKVVNNLDKDLYNMRKQKEIEMRKWDYMNIAKKLETIILE